MGGEGVDRAVNARFAIFLGRFAHCSVVNNKPPPDDSLLHLGTAVVIWPFFAGGRSVIHRYALLKNCERSHPRC